MPVRYVSLPTVASARPAGALLACACLLFVFGFATIRFISFMLGTLRDDVVGIAAEIGASGRDVVEAARAASIGAGFAVAADEVHALASRCSDAAHHTAPLIEESIRRSKEGTAKVNLVAASGSQSNGVAQVVGLVNNMKTVNRHSAFTMELTAERPNASSQNQNFSIRPPIACWNSPRRTSPYSLTYLLPDVLATKTF